MEMIHLPGGTIALGTPTTAIDELMQRYAINFRGLFTPETPQHTVKLAPFAIGPYPVTNRQFKTFVDDQPQWCRDRILAHLHNGSYLHHWQENQYPTGQAEHPVVYICWYAAVAYAQ